MLSLLSALLGFSSSFFPELIKFFQRKQDNQQELELMKLQIEASKNEHTYRMEEITANADVAEAVELHKPQQSFGVQLLDAGDKYADTVWGKVLLTPVFYLFAAIDFLNGTVRPLITFGIVSLYGLVKFATYQVALESHTTQQAIISIWTEQDFAVLTLVLGYWFGARLYKAAFGGSTQDTKRN